MDEKKREYIRKWKEAHPEKVREYTRAGAHKPNRVKQWINRIMSQLKPRDY